MKKMLTHHTPRKKKNERENLKRGQKTQNSKFSLVVILRRRKNESAKNFAVKCWPHQKPKKRRKKTLLWLFLSFPHFSSSSLCFLSFFLSLRPRNQNSFFFSRALKQKERDWEERLREAFEKAFFDSFYLYEYIKGRRRWKFFFNDSPHF